MVFEYWELLERFKEYGNPKTKLARLIKADQFIPIRRGLYVDDPSTNPLVLASAIYGPSYISFQKALEWHGLIPEKVPVISCATYCKNRNKQFITPLGTFTYTDVPPQAYPLGVDLIQEGDFSFFVASAPKALCDMVYKVKALSSVSQMADLLLEDWRMEIPDLCQIHFQDIEILAPFYRRGNLLLLIQFFRSLK